MSGYQIDIQLYSWQLFEARQGFNKKAGIFELDKTDKLLTMRSKSINTLFIAHLTGRSLQDVLILQQIKGVLQVGIHQQIAFAAG